MALLATAVVAYPELLTFSQLPLADDGHTSDIFNGELPHRVEFGRILAQGEIPEWSSTLGGGIPIGAGAQGDFISGILFALLPAAAALSAFLLYAVWVAAQSTYTLCRRLGAGPLGAWFGGTAFASGGYFVAQFRHTSVLATVAWLPLQLYLLDVAFSCSDATGTREDKSIYRRLRSLSWFGALVWLQLLAGFPQSVYISLLVCGLYSLALFVHDYVKRKNLKESLAVGTYAIWVIGIAAAGAAITLLPLKELADHSQRGDYAWLWANTNPYQWSDILSFFWPNLHGDAATNTYTGKAPYWEVYSYSGVLTAILGFTLIFTGLRRTRVALLTAIGVFSLVMVLGPNTPLFAFFWDYLPGLSLFRFPTRFLVVSCLSLSVLAGLQLTRFQTWIDSNRTMTRVASRFGAGRGPKLGSAVSAIAILALSTDLFCHQRMHNPWGPAERWLSPPKSVEFLRTQENVLTHAVLHTRVHRNAHVMANGWQDLEPYYWIRETLPPNLGALFQVRSIDIYSGAAPGHWARVWGDHVHLPLLTGLRGAEQRGPRLTPSFLRMMQLYGVTHLLTPLPLQGPVQPPIAFRDKGVWVHEIRGKRARCFSRAAHSTSDRQALQAALHPRFLANDELLVHERTPLSVPGKPLKQPRTRLHPSVREVSSKELRIDVTTCQGGFLFLADNHYPGWRAQVDGRDVDVTRALVTGRAVPLRPNSREVIFTFHSSTSESAALISLAAILLFGLGAGLLRVAERRSH